MKSTYFLLSAMTASLLLVGCNGDNVDTGSNEINSKKISSSEVNVSQSSKNENSEVERVVTHGNFVEYETEAELFADAELVVIASTNEDFMDREHIVKYVPSSDEEEGLPKAIEDFYTKTSITVEQVLKQPASEKVADNKKISVIEPIALLEDGSKILSVENYQEISRGQQYIIYLKKNTNGEYGVINMTNGRFNLESTDQIVNLAEHGHDNDKAKHEKMKDTVKNRFAKEIAKAKK